MTRITLKGSVMNSGIPIEFSQRTEGAVKVASNPLLKPEWGAHIMRVLNCSNLQPHNTTLPTDEGARNQCQKVLSAYTIQATISKA
jgi:hypothetical protein